MLQLYLLRHGKTCNNANNITQDTLNDIDLLPEAVVELQNNIANIVSKLSNNVYILCSPMLRAMHTSKILETELTLQGKAFNKLTMDALCEVNFGLFGSMPDDFAIHGQTMQDYRRMTKEFYADINNYDVAYNAQYPGGENLLDIHDRCLQVKNKIMSIAKYGFNGDVICVGHNRLFRHMLVEFYAMSNDDMFNDKLPHAELIPVAKIGANVVCNHDMFVRKDKSSYKHHNVYEY